jgi:hypothetical protein
MARLAETKARIPFYDKEFGLSDQRTLELYLSTQVPFRPNLVFVMMSFLSDEMQDAYAAIQDACARIGLDALRIDENIGSGLIVREIATMINEAEFIVCDLTHERPNVYYELGYAHGTGNSADNILLIARDGTKPHFDIAPLRIHFYRSTEHLRSVISDKLDRMVRGHRSAACVQASRHDENAVRPSATEGSVSSVAASLQAELRMIGQALSILQRKLDPDEQAPSQLTEAERKELSSIVHSLSQHHIESDRRYQSDIFPYAAQSESQQP